jgi:hypothetical protein
VSWRALKSPYLQVFARRAVLGWDGGGYLDIYLNKYLKKYGRQKSGRKKYQKTGAYRQAVSRRDAAH